MIGVAANGALVRLTRDVGNVAIDASGVERLAVTPLAGADTVNLGNLTGTGVLRRLAQPGGHRERHERVTEPPTRWP